MENSEKFGITLPLTPYKNLEYKYLLSVRVNLQIKKYCKKEHIAEDLSQRISSSMKKLYEVIFQQNNGKAVQNPQF